MNSQLKGVRRAGKRDAGRKTAVEVSDAADEVEEPASDGWFFCARRQSAAETSEFASDGPIGRRATGSWVFMERVTIF